jgi:hypothetical protein
MRDMKLIREQRLHFHFIFFWGQHTGGAGDKEARGEHMAEPIIL